MHHQGLHWLPQQAAAEVAITKAAAAQAAMKTGCAKIHLRFFVFFLSLWAMASGHSSGLPPQEAPVMIAEKRKVLFSFQVVQHTDHTKACMYR